MRRTSCSFLVGRSTCSIRDRQRKVVRDNASFRLVTSSEFPVARIGVGVGMVCMAALFVHVLHRSDAIDQWVAPASVDLVLAQGPSDSEIAPDSVSAVHVAIASPSAVASPLVTLSPTAGNRGAFPVPHPALLQVIVDEARTTGLAPEFALALVSKESGFDRHAKSTRSTARGLFQFTDRTWLEAVERFGAEGPIAETLSGLGRAEILHLRHHEITSTTIAVRYIAESRDRLTRSLGRAPTSSELYASHFFGRTGVVEFMSHLRKSPSATAADLFPDFAKANPSLFHDADKGKPLSVSEVNLRLRQRLDQRMIFYSTMVRGITQVAGVGHPPLLPVSKK
jgi:hypothetical protein